MLEIKNLRFHLDKAYRMGRSGVLYPNTRLIIPEILEVLDKISEKSKTEEGRNQLYKSDFLKRFNDIYLGDPNK